MPPLEHGQYPAVPEVSVTASPAAPSLFSSGVTVSVVNKSLFPMICRFEAQGLGGPRPLDPEFVWVDAQTAAELNLRVPLRFPPARAVTVNAHHPATTVAYETVVRAPLAVPAAFVLLLALLAAGTGLAVFRRPAAVPQAQVLALSAPPSVLAGDAVQVRYATQNARSVHYDVHRGRADVQNADVPPGSGTFAFRAVAPGSYRIVLHVTGQSGSVDSAQDVQARATPAPAAVASIGSLSVDPPVATSGSVIHVQYASSGSSGTVRLIDEKGVPWAAQPWSREGETLLKAPSVTSPQRFTIALAVAAGKTAASAQTALLVVPPAPTATPAPIAAATGAPGSAAQGAAMPNSIRVGTSPNYLASGEYFRVSVNGVSMSQVQRIVLQAANGTAIAAHDSSTLGALFAAPVVSKVERYFIVVTLAQNRAGGLIVQPVDVHPR